MGKNWCPDDGPLHLSKQMMCIPCVSASLIKCNDYMQGSISSSIWEWHDYSPSVIGLKTVTECNGFTSSDAHTGSTTEHGIVKIHTVLKIHIGVVSIPFIGSTPTLWGISIYLLSPTVNQLNIEPCMPYTFASPPSAVGRNVYCVAHMLVIVRIAGKT